MFRPPPPPVEPPDDGPPDEPAEPPRPSLPPTLREYCELITPSWSWGWRHLVALDEVYDKVLAGELKRVIIELPTRIGKTEKGVRFLSYALEREPTIPLILGGYNDKFARRLSRKVRRIVEGRIPLSRDRKASEEWETDAGGGLRAAGVGVGIAGLPAKGIYIDDPTKSRADAYSKAHRDAVDEWFREDVYTRLEPDGWIVICMARRHEDDLVGRILAGEDAADWTVLRLPALAESDDPLGRAEGEALCPERFDEAYYAKMRRAIGEAAFASLQQQRPAPASGLVFKSEWFRYYTTRDHPIIDNGIAVPFAPDKFDEELQSWDMSFKDTSGSDFVAGHVWARSRANIYLKPDRIHGRKDFPATIAAVRDLTKRNPNAKLKLVEDKANGPAVISTLRSQIPGLVGVDPEGDKVARAHAVTYAYESGNVWLPHPGIAPWIKGYVLEHLQFPLGAHDDDVDAGTQAVRRLLRNLEQERPDEAPPSVSYNFGRG